MRDELLVRDISDATALVDAIRRRQFQASPERQDMTLAQLNLLDELTPIHRFDDIIPPLIRHLIGDETADLLLVPDSDLDRARRQVVSSCTSWAGSSAICRATT